MTSGSLKKKWRVLYVRPRWEKKVDVQLEERGIERFLPLREEVRQWSDRKKKVIAPLFPGYIFVHVDERERNITFDLHGTVNYVHFSGVLAEVRPDIIDSLRIAVSAPADIEVTGDRLESGTPIKIVHGPMTGVKGMLIEYRGEKRIAIVVDSIRQAVVMEVGLNEVQVVGERLKG